MNDRLKAEVNTCPRESKSKTDERIAKLKRTADILYGKTTPEHGIYWKGDRDNSSSIEKDNDVEDVKTETSSKISDVEEDDEDILDLFYPTMKNLKSKNKTSSLRDEIKSQTSSDSAKVSDNDDEYDILDLMYPSMRSIQSKFKTGMKTGNKTAFEMKEPETTKDFNEDFTVGKMDYKPKNNKHGIVTGGASSVYDNYDGNSKLLIGEINITDTDKSSKTIAGVKKGNEMTIEEAMKGTNPGHSPFGNYTLKTNCQSTVSVFELRKRGYPVEYKIPKTDEENSLHQELMNFPNRAFIDPKTGKTPEFTEIKAKNSDELTSALKSTIKEGERYFFIYYSKYFRRNEKNSETARHIIEVMKDKNGRLLFVDPQSNVKLPEEFALNVTLDYKKFEEKMYPKIMRVDDKELNYEVLNKITQPEGTYQNKIKHKK